LNAVAGTVQYVLVANVAAIPGTPGNGDAIEIADSTGIESFTPLTNLPAGFVGDSGLSVRLQYLSSGSSWNWLNYFANNAETRYLKLAGGTLTGQLKADDSTSVAAPVIAFDGDTNTGVAHTGADELALVTGGTSRLTIDSSGAVAIAGALTKGGNNVVTVGDTGTVTSTMLLDGTILNADINASAAIAGTKISPDFGSQNVTTTGNVTVNAQGDLRFGDADSSNWVAFQGPATVSSNVTWTLPSADGTANQVLSTNGSGTLSWATAAASGATVTTSDTAPSTPVDGDLWYDSVGGRLYVYYQDPNGSQWVDAAPQGGGSSTPTKIEVGNTKAEVTDTGSNGTFTVTTEGTANFIVSSSGNVGVGTTPSSSSVAGSTIEVNNPGGGIVATSPADVSFTNNSYYNAGWIYGTTNPAARLQLSDGNFLFYSAGSGTAGGALTFTERMRLRSDGRLYINTSNGASPTVANTSFADFGGASDTYGLYLQSHNATTAYFNRQADDGTVIDIRQGGVSEGSISVSGTTVSYNGAHLSRWSQLPGGAERSDILRGTVLSNIDEMCEWGEEENEQLNRMKVSDVEGDPNVSGVFQAWDDDDDTYTDDFYCAMTGDFIIRISAGIPVHRGQLLMSAGDGTAKPQDDDIIRSKTIAKVTSNHVTCTYDDGSYCVPCVLMAC
jgi:hypothetical protein